MNELLIQRRYLALALAWPELDCHRQIAELADIAFFPE